MPNEEPIIGNIIKDKPASILGLQKDDRIVKVNDYNISSWSDMSKSYS